MSKENNPQNEGLSDEIKKVLEQMIAQRITRAEMARDKTLEEQRKKQITKCISCDAEITEGAKFCSSCGASQIQETQTIADEDEEETPLVPNFQRLKIAHRIVIGFCIIAILGIIVTVSEGNTDGMLSLGIGVFFTLVYFISTFGSIKDITNDIFTDSKLLPIGLKICGYISGFFAVIIAAMVLIMPYIFIGISDKVNQPIEWDWSMLLIVAFIAVPFSMLYYLYHSFKILTYVDLMEVEYVEEQAQEENQTSKDISSNSKILGSNATIARLLKRWATIFVVLVFLCFITYAFWIAYNVIDEGSYMSDYEKFALFNMMIIVGLLALAVKKLRIDLKLIVMFSVFGVILTFIFFALTYILFPIRIPNQYTTLAPFDYKEKEYPYAYSNHDYYLCKKSCPTLNKPIKEYIGDDYIRYVKGKEVYSWRISALGGTYPLDYSCCCNKSTWSEYVFGLLLLFEVTFEHFPSIAIFSLLVIVYECIRKKETFDWLELVTYSTDKSIDKDKVFFYGVVFVLTITVYNLYYIYSQ